MNSFKKLIALVVASVLFASCSLYYRPGHTRNIGRNNTNTHNAPGFR